MKPDRWLVVSMAAVWLVAGVVEPHLPNAGQPFNAVGVVQTLAFALLLFGWCKAHANAQHIVMPTGGAVFSALLPPVGVPYYFLRGFGWRRGSVLVLVAIALLIGFEVLYFAAFAVSSRIGI